MTNAFCIVIVMLIKLIQKCSLQKHPKCACGATVQQEIHMVVRKWLCKLFVL